MRLSTMMTPPRRWRGGCSTMHPTAFGGCSPHDARLAADRHPPRTGNATTVARAPRHPMLARCPCSRRALPWTPAAGDFDVLLLTSAGVRRRTALAALAAAPLCGGRCDRGGGGAGMTIVRTGEADAKRLLDAMAAEKITGFMALRSRPVVFDPCMTIQPLPCYIGGPGRSAARMVRPDRARRCSCAPAARRAGSPRWRDRRAHLALVDQPCGRNRGGHRLGRADSERSRRTLECWHWRPLCATRAKNRVVRKRHMATSNIDSPAPEAAVPPAVLSPADDRRAAAVDRRDRWRLGASRWLAGDRAVLC